MDPSVAARLAASPSATSSRSHSSSSPSTSRLAHSSSVTGLNGEDSIMSSAMTIEQVLAAHASAPDPLRAALESVLHERNSLSAQNSQLWNHLKKQRSNYQMAASDVKRIRAERDNLRSRLARYEHLGSSEHFEDKRTRPLAHGTATEMTTDYNEKSSSEQAHQLHFTSRPKPSRHQSEDRTGKQTFPGLCSNLVGVINFFFKSQQAQVQVGRVLHLKINILRRRLHIQHLGTMRGDNREREAIPIPNLRLLLRRLAAMARHPHLHHSRIHRQHTNEMQVTQFQEAFSVELLPRLLSSPHAPNPYHLGPRLQLQTLLLVNKSLLTGM